MYSTDIHLAVDAVTKATQIDPELRSKAALWLGQVLAQQPPQRDRTTPTQ